MPNRGSKILNTNLKDRNCINCFNLKTKVFEKDKDCDLFTSTYYIIKNIFINFRSSNNVRCVKNNIIGFDKDFNTGIRKGTDNKPLNSVLKSLRHYETIALHCEDYDSEI